MADKVSDLETQKKGNVDFAAAAAHQGAPLKRTVEIDSSPFFDPYNIPVTAKIVYAVSKQFSEDRSKKLLPLHSGRWLLETDEINHYENVDVLSLNGEDLAKLRVRTTRPEGGASGSGGSSWNNRENDLLITLFQGNTARFEDVARDAIYKKIVEIGVGTVKKGITVQMYKDSDIPNGNLYFILTDVNKSTDLEKIPQSFDFLENGTTKRMWLNFRGKKRKCFFCAEIHDVSICPVQEKVKRMEDERKARLNDSGVFNVKIYGDSTLRHVSQGALASEVDAMSGATTGNILNAIEVDRPNVEIKNIVIASGQNEMNPHVSKEEFLWILKSKTERVVSLAETKKIAILAPPPQGFVDPESQVREFFFHDCMKSICELSENVSVWKNPLAQYSADGGQHPTQEESTKLVQYLAERVKSSFGEDLVLTNADDNLLTSKSYYSKVNSLYKFGCAACSSRVQNKWRLLCDVCEVNSRNVSNEDLMVAISEYDAALERQISIMLPPLSKSVPLQTLSRDRSPLKSSNENIFHPHGDGKKHKGDQ